MEKYLKRTALALAVLCTAQVAQAEVEPITEVFEPQGQFGQSEYAKVAVVQWNAYSPAPLTQDAQVAEDYKQSNREQLADFVRQAAAAGAELVVTPEFGVVNYPDIPELPDEDDNFRNREDITPYVESIPGPSTEYFSELAKELNVYVHFGLAEVDAATGKYYNAVVAVDPKGEIVAVFRKMNLFTHENDFLSPGENLAYYDSPAGRIGFLICADVYAPQVLMGYRALGVNILALSTSWAQYNTGMGYFQRGAVSAGAFLLAANQTYFPDSGVVNPDGTLQSHIRQSEGIAYGYVPRPTKAQIRP